MRVSSLIICDFRIMFQLHAHINICSISKFIPQFIYCRCFIRMWLLHNLSTRWHLPASIFYGSPYATSRTLRCPQPEDTWGVSSGVLRLLVVNTDDACSSISTSLSHLLTEDPKLFTHRFSYCQQRWSSSEGCVLCHCCHILIWTPKTLFISMSCEKKGYLFLHAGELETKTTCVVG